MLIEFYQKKIYGKHYNYPSSTDAKTLCRLIKRPTLTLGHLRICKDAGWRIVEIENNDNDDQNILEI